MDRRQLVLLVSAVAALQVCVSASTCKIPSRFWCDSQQVALECGVYEQCKNFHVLHQDAAPVDFTLYYESLCPYSKAFIINKLYPTYLKLASITNLTLVPYGNAKERQVDNRWVFRCQHGPDECLGNIISTCTIAIVKNIAVYFPFLNCLESSSLSSKTAAQQCATKFPVPLDQILNCTTSDYGNQLQHEMAVRTDALNPPKDGVPWVTLNGLASIASLVHKILDTPVIHASQSALPVHKGNWYSTSALAIKTFAAKVHTEAIQNEAESNLAKLLCDTYRGVKPPACSSV